MKKLLGILFIFVVLVGIPLRAGAVMYQYDISGIINFSDLGNNDPFITPGASTFDITGFMSDSNSHSTSTLSGRKSSIDYSGIAFYTLPSLGRDEIDLNQGYYFADVFTSFHISAFDSSQTLISDSGILDCDVANSLDWKIMWVGVAPQPSPTNGSPVHWEWSGVVTNVNFSDPPDPSIAPVPEPSTLLLISLGLAIIAFLKIKQIGYN